MKNETEIVSQLKSRRQRSASWSKNVEEYAATYGHLNPADIPGLTNDQLWKLWTASKFAETGTPSLPTPTADQWEGLRKMTQLLCDRSQALGERFNAARAVYQKTFTADQVQLPVLLRTLLILEGGRYGTIGAKSHMNRLLQWAGKPEMDYRNPGSITSALENVRAIIEAWAVKVGTDSLGERAYISWHLCEIIRDNLSNQEIPTQKPTRANELAAPFDQFFASFEEAQWAFDFLKEMLVGLGVRDVNDQRVALTLPIKGNCLRLNFCQWVITSFFGEDEAPDRVHITLMKDSVDLVKKDTFKTDPGEPIVCTYGLPFEKLRAKEPKLRSALDKSLDFIASRFSEQEKSGYRNKHQPKLMEMIFDKEKRTKYLTEGLSAQSDTSYWKIAPGDDAWQWGDCQKDKFIAVGWDAFGDLSGVDHTEFDRRCDKLLPENPKWTKIGCEQLWKFAQIKKNDRIVANKGTTEVKGIGTVTGKYYFVPDVVFGHRLPVKWDDVRPRQVEKGGWKRTLISLSEEDFNDILNALPAVDPVDATPFESNASNTILYGPPGTGKTYKTIERAVQIIEPDFTGDHAAYKARFDVLRAKGQIEFITFHQSYSYEDFVEGLRPVIEGPESSEAAYEYSSGVFKQFAFQALFDCLKPTADIVSFDTVWKKLVEQTELEPDKLYPGLSEKTSYRISLSTKGNLDGINTISNKTFLCSRSVLEKVFVAKPENEKVTSSEVMEVVVRGCHSHFVAAMFNELKRIEKSEFAGKRPSQTANISSEQKAGIAQAFLEKNDTGTDAFKPASDWPQYVLVIDEINRGNISKILGELITLIEPDKRLGAENSLVVTLPYTKHSFGVPGNLHLLGTMNTADKSIALVDVALRRRFQFEELRANFDHCEGLTQPMRELLDALNRRICLRKDRDHQIGHSYFIKVSDAAGFNRVFARHVVPLLQEYFYNDWDGLRFVLGVKNQPDKLIIPLKDGDAGDSRSSWQWSFEAGYNSVNDVDFLQMFGGNDPAA
jgi:hypothetical protein